MSKSTHHLALATIETESGRRWIFYNGPGRPLSAESDDGSIVTPLCITADSIDQASHLILEHYGRDDSCRLAFIEDTDA